MMPFLVFLKDSGSNIVATGDYSGSTTSFVYTCSDHQQVDIYSFTVSAVAKDLGIDTYGGVVLSNGILMSINGVIANSDLPVRTFQDMRSYGVKEEILRGQITGTFTFASPITLLNGDTFGFVLNDDFSHLSDHKFFVSGSIVS